MNIKLGWLLANVASLVLSFIYIMTFISNPSSGSAILYKMSLYCLLTAYGIVLYIVHKPRFGANLNFIRQLGQDENFWYYMTCMYFSGSQPPYLILLLTLDLYALYHVVSNRALLTLSSSPSSSSPSSSSSSTSPPKKDETNNQFKTSIEKKLESYIDTFIKAKTGVMLQAAQMEIITFFSILFSVFLGRSPFMHAFYFAYFLYHRYRLSGTMKYIVDAGRTAIISSPYCPAPLKRYL